MAVIRSPTSSNAIDSCGSGECHTSLYGGTMIGHARTMFGSIGAIATAGVLAGALLAASGGVASAAPASYRAVRAKSVAESIQQAVTARPDAHAATSVPPGLQPPAGNVLEAQFVGRGVQVYQCTAGAWVFLEPAANLVGYEIGTSGIQTAIHYKGPTWESTTDGSLVQGTAIASEPVTGSIPQLLLEATASSAASPTSIAWTPGEAPRRPAPARAVRPSVCRTRRSTSSTCLAAHQTCELSH